MLIINKLYWYNNLGDWTPKLQPILQDTEYISKLFNYLHQEYNSTRVIPSINNLFKPFTLSEYSNLKVVILGVEPVIQSDGLAYSYEKETKVIIDQIEKTMYNGLNLLKEDDLSYLAEQGVLFLNVSITSTNRKKLNHLEPWSKFINQIFTVLNEYNSGLIFCLWGNYLKINYKDKINSNLHYILEYDKHPIECINSKDWNCNHFSEINEILIKNNTLKIEW